MAEPAEIASALFARCATISTGSPTLPVAYPESAATFTPPADGKYLEVAFFSNRPAWEGLASGRMDQGLLQVTVVWPKNKGIVGPSRHAASVMAHFPKGLALADGVRVSGQPYASSPLIEASDVRVPVTIPWIAV